MNSILLVDDESVICSAIQKTLGDIGFSVTTAHTVETAARLARKVQFDAVLLEFNIRSERSARPRSGSGLKLIRRLRKFQRGTPIFMYTVMEGDLYETASFDADADDFIVKTSSVASVGLRIRAHIRRQRRSAKSAMK